MSKDDLSDLPPIEGNPLDGDLLEDMAQPAAGSPLTAGGELITDEGVALTPTAAATAEETTSEPPAEEAKPKGPSFLARLARSNPYTVMLFASLTALLIGVLCLLLEWSSYGFQIKPD